MLEWVSNCHLDFIPRSGGKTLNKEDKQHEGFPAETANQDSNFA
jgi:hypothetical protein